MRAKTLLLTVALALVTSHARAQAPPASSTRRTDAANRDLITPTGSAVSGGIASYTYREPGDQPISIHGAKFVLDYTGTLAIAAQRHWFAQGQFRSTLGNTTYDGWCSPFQITPN